MKTYEVGVDISLIREYTVEAENEQEAKEKAEQLAESDYPRAQINWIYEPNQLNNA